MFSSFFVATGTTRGGEYTAREVGCQGASDEHESGGARDLPAAQKRAMERDSGRNRR